MGYNLSIVLLSLGIYYGIGFVLACIAARTERFFNAVDGMMWLFFWPLQLLAALFEGIKKK